MLDPLTAVSLAGTIVQFVDFSSKVVFKIKQLKSADERSVDLFSSEIVIKDLCKLSEKLKDGLYTYGMVGLSAEDQALRDVCDGCISLSNTMLGRLNLLKVKEHDSNFKLIRQALRTVWSETEMEAMSVQLGNFRSQLQLRIFTAFKQQWDLNLLSRQAWADDHAKALIDALCNNHDVFESGLVQQTNTIVNLHLETRKFNTNEHDATRTVIIDAIKQVSRKGYDGEKRPTRQNVISGREELEIKRQAEDRILKSLLFPSITARYLQVSKAHEATFEWIFETPQSEDHHRWSSFADWLQFGNGIYWISGKAGSGKSTLMKFLSDHQRTRQLLQSWSSPLSPNIASFYFWNSGTPEQKSCNGLLRTLLHEVLSDHRDLIPVILPDQWKDEYISPTEFYQRFQWSFGIMCEAFHLLRTQKSFRLCLFIDGLDEYEADSDGTHGDVAILFNTIVSSSNIKICASSRPWLVFEDAFRSNPSLQVQHLSSNDINRYVEDKLYGSVRMTQLRAADPVNTDFLVEEIVSKASGVFLWVVLVVKSLLHGLTNRDRISDLRRRLELLPADLEDLYRHMLVKHIDSFYHEQSAQIFRIVLAIKTGEYRIPKEVNLLMLAFADDDEDEKSLSRTPVKQLNRNQLSIKCGEMSDRLKSRCAGLLEISGDESQVTELEVNFLHRTVYDFLKLPEIQSMLDARTSAKFDPFQCLLKGCVLWLKQVTVSRVDDSFLDVLRLVRTSLIHARQSHQLKRNGNLLILDELDKTATYHWMSVARICEESDRRFSGQHWADDQNHRPIAVAETSHDNFTSLAVEYGLTEYVRAKLKEDCMLVKKKVGSPHLSYVGKNGDCRQPDIEMVQLLLQHGTTNVEVKNMIDLSYHLSRQSSTLATQWGCINEFLLSISRSMPEEAIAMAQSEGILAFPQEQDRTVSIQREAEVEHKRQEIFVDIPWEIRTESPRQETPVKKVKSWLQQKLQRR